MRIADVDGSPATGGALMHGRFRKTKSGERGRSVLKWIWFRDASVFQASKNRPVDLCSRPQLAHHHDTKANIEQTLGPLVRFPFQCVL